MAGYKYGASKPAPPTPAQVARERVAFWSEWADYMERNQAARDAYHEVMEAEAREPRIQYAPQALGRKNAGNWVISPTARQVARNWIVSPKTRQVARKGTT